MKKRMCLVAFLGLLGLLGFGVTVRCLLLSFTNPLVLLVSIPVWIGSWSLARRLLRSARTHLLPNDVALLLKKSGIDVPESFDGIDAQFKKMGFDISKPEDINRFIQEEREVENAR